MTISKRSTLGKETESSASRDNVWKTEGQLDHCKEFGVDPRELQRIQQDSKIMQGLQAGFQTPHIFKGIVFIVCCHFMIESVSTIIQPICFKVLHFII